MSRVVTPLLGFALIASAAFSQSTRYVDGAAGVDGADCIEIPCATIGYALGQADPGDTIQIADGEYTESITIDTSLALIGQSEAGTIIQAHASPESAGSRVVTITSGVEVEIAHVTIRHGVAMGPGIAGAGGGLLGQEASLILSHVTILRNTAMVGGGVADLEGSFSATNATFSQNSAVEVNFNGGAGGGLYNFNNDASLTNVTFSGNHADVQGGGIQNQINTATIQDVTFLQNTANGYGGAIHNWTASAVIADVTISGSYAPWGAGMYTLGQSAIYLNDIIFNENGGGAYGGGMYNNNAGTVELQDVAFHGNTSAHGGGIYNEGTAPVLRNVHFVQNIGGGVSPSSGGGGMYNDHGSSPELTNVTFVENMVFTNAARGGGLYNFGEATSLINVSFTGNGAIGANGSGGGMENAGNHVSFTNVTFTDNTARAGGGLRNTGSAPALVDVAFFSNHANSGGGMYGAAGTAPELVNVTFAGNAALPGTVGAGGGFGGGIYNTGSSPVFTGGTFDGNVADGGGGGMMNVGGAPALSAVVFAGNTVTGSSLGDGGGAMRNTNSAVTLAGVEFTDNVSAASAGGVHQAGGSLDLHDVIFRGNASALEAGRSGGGIRMTDTEATFVEVRFLENEAFSGAGMHVAGGSLMLANGRFIGNVTGDSGARSGGGIRLSGGGEATLVNVEFFDNQAFNGAALSVEERAVTVANGSFSGNSASFNGGGIRTSSGGAVTLLNTVVWGNTAGSNGNEIFSGSSNPVDLSFSLYSDGPGDLFGEFAIENSLTEDPLFVDAGGGDLRLDRNSPAIDAGDPETDLSLFPGGPINPVDLDGNPRVSGGRVDIGAYEYPVPANDHIADAIVIPTVDAAYTGSNVNATLEDGEPEPTCIVPELTTNHSVWWAFKAEVDGRVTIDTSGSLTPGGDGLDTVLSLHRVADLGEVACDDSGGEGTQSLIEDAPIFKGEAYLIRVAGYDASPFSQGTIQLAVAFELSVAGEPPPGRGRDVLVPPRPNPVTGIATTEVVVRRRQHIVVELFDVRGRRVQTLFDGNADPLRAVRLQVDASSLAAGVYVIRVMGEDFTASRRVTIVK